MKACNWTCDLWLLFIYRWLSGSDIQLHVWATWRYHINEYVLNLKSDEFILENGSKILIENREVDTWMDLHFSNEAVSRTRRNIIYRIIEASTWIVQFRVFRFSTVAHFN